MTFGGVFASWGRLGLNLVELSAIVDAIIFDLGHWARGLE